MINFSGLSTHLGLFYASSLGNCIYCMFIFTFLCSLLRVSGVFFAHDPIEYELYLIDLFDQYLTGMGVSIYIGSM